MADQCYMLEDPLYASERWILTRKELYGDVGRFSEAWEGVRSAMLAEAGVFADVIEGNRTFTIREAGAFADGFTLGGTQTVTISEVLRARDQWRIGAGQSIAEAGTFDEAYTAGISITIREAGQFDEAFSLHGAPSAMLSDQRRFRDRVFSSRGDSLAEIGTFADALTTRRSATLQEAGTFADLLAPSARAIVVLRESATFHDELTPHRTPRGMLADDGWLDERYLVPPAAVQPDGHTAHRTGPTTGWTANTDTWGMSRYTDWPINSMAVVDGVLLGAGEDGLYRLDAADDAGEPINAHVTTGKQDYQAEQLKGVSVLYVGAKAGGLMQVTTDVAPKGVPTFYTYEFEDRRADDFAPLRAKLARGVRSRYWKFTVGNTAGADFVIDSVSVNAAAGPRRV